MRLFVTRLAIFVVPWILYALAVVLVDPFDKFRVGHLVPETSKAMAAPVFNNGLWKVIRFEQDPGENITLGSSQMNNIKVSLIKDVSGLDYRNLAINGGSLVDIIQMFWFAESKTTLRRVCIGVNISNFNRATDRDLLSGALATERSALSYVVNRDVLAAGANLVAATYFGGSLRSDAPAMSKDAFWEREITYGTARNFFNYRFDEDAFLRLQEVAAYCRTHGIDLKFLILPSHQEVHAQIRAFGVTAAWAGLARRLSELGRTYDFDVDDGTTSDRARFNDPFHFDQSVARAIAERAFAQP
jgi:hypothetical protein